jgi:sec-independent protein translocase protein TatC
VRRLYPRRLRHGEEATLVEHLGELRARLVISLLAIAVAFAVVFPFHEELIRWLSEPLPEGRRLQTLGVLEPLTNAVKVSFLASLAFAFPVLVYQLWAFLAPAVEEHVQRVVSSFVVVASALFAAGVAFGYFILLPKAIGFLADYDSELYDIQIRASYYFSFVAMSMLGMGVIFELPIFILALVRLQVVTSAQLRRNWRLAILLSFVVAILMPTVDPVSLAFEVTPIIALYFLSVGLATIMERRWARAGVLWAAPE